MKKQSVSATRIAALGAAALTSVAAVGGAGATAEQATPDKNIVQTAARRGPVQDADQPRAAGRTGRRALRARAS